tara:strand:+ start:89 stop:466 length:378 start_codon:yes stop_codon:yes gene_type:complete
MLQSGMDKEAAAFLLNLLHSSTNVHLMHWTTDSYSAHKTLGKFYQKIIDLADDFAEALMGKYGQLAIQDFPADYHAATDPIAYLEGLSDFVGESREHLPQDTELQNIVDEIAQLIDSTLFLLKLN